MKVEHCAPSRAAAGGRRPGGQESVRTRVLGARTPEEPAERETEPGLRPGRTSGAHVLTKLAQGSSVHPL